MSTKRQGDSLDRQRETLVGDGCEKVLTNTISSVKSERPGTPSCSGVHAEGDVLVTTRLWRTALDTLRTINNLDSRGVPVVILDLALRRGGIAHARSRGGRHGRSPSSTPNRSRLFALLLLTVRPSLRSLVPSMFHVRLSTES
ncbi:recombinase family protein [Corynebacterium pygosceleis]|uniref:recombinase family protein n=1 Tax=Corynebacterium pygosceleis TaxID=2800406 RepID=UPI00396A0CB6